MGRSRYRFGEPGSPHFLSCAVVGRLPVFTRPENVQILFDSWQFLGDRNRMDLLGYVIFSSGRKAAIRPKMIEDEEMMRQKLAYIHANPVKRGYASDPTH